MGQISRLIISVILTVLLLSFLFGGKESPKDKIDVKVNTENNLTKNASAEINIFNTLVSIKNGLWYDQETMIVYWWNGCFGNSWKSTTPSPYYAPNGFPYRYNPETNALEEINYTPPEEE